MRRSASETIRNLEMRIARLEKRSRFEKSSNYNITDGWVTTTADKDELSAGEDLFQMLENKDEFLRVFLKCLSLRRLHSQALKISRSLSIDISTWENDRHISKLAQGIRIKSVDGICRIFALLNYQRKFVNQNKFMKVINSLKVRVVFHRLNSLEDWLTLIFPNKKYKYDDYEDLVFMSGDPKITSKKGGEEDTDYDSGILTTYYYAKASGMLVYDELGKSVSNLDEYIEEVFMEELSDYLYQVDLNEWIPELLEIVDLDVGDENKEVHEGSVSEPDIVNGTLILSWDFLITGTSQEGNFEPDWD